MSINAWKKELNTFLQQKTRKHVNVVVMPDFFLDRLINFEINPDKLTALIKEIAKRKGGSIDGIPQTDIRGGNAINTASALAMLDAKVTPIVCTNLQGLNQIKYYFKDLPIDTSHIKIHNQASITTALELKSGSEKTNIMIRDLGSLQNFSPKNLDEKDYSLIEEADYVCLFNWTGTLKFGTELAQAIFSRTKTNGKGKTYYDTADPTPNREEIDKLMQKVLKSNAIDILSLNENEAITYASIIDKNLKDKKEQIDFSELAMEAARVLNKNLTARIDLHTTAFSATLTKKKETVVPTFRVKVLRATGAGDAWNAGNIIGDANNLSDECRLMLANAVSASYITSPEGKHPTISKLQSFLKNTD